MRKWIVRFVSLYVFNVVVLLIIGLILPTVSVGWAAFWASVILTAATLWLKPLITKMFRGMAARSSGQRTKAGEKVVQYVLVFIVELIVWLLVVWLSGVSVRGWFWGYLLPPIILLIAWAIYDAVDDRVEARTGQLYDKATGKPASGDDAAVEPPSAAQQAGERELKDGLTDEQRRMLDDLGNG
jgi:small-conductance mechanosensitive channel